MLIGENLFTTFASTDAVAAHAATSNSQTANLMLQEAPKLDNNDLLLENLDFNLIVDEAPNHTNVSAPSTSINVEAELFDSVFKNDNDPLLDNILIDDNELKDIFSFEIDEDEKQQQEAQELNEIVIKHEDEFNFENFIDSRSHSLPVIPSSITKNIITSETLSPVDAVSPGSKRSYSTSNIGSTDNRPSKKKNDLGCTPYARKQRNLPLPPVVPKGEDTASMKRARNTEAARRSRARKMERMTQLESKCETLLNENNELKLQIEQLKKLLEGK